MTTRYSVLVMLLFGINLSGFHSLKQATEYAQNNKEYHAFENKNIYNPDYSSWYELSQPTILQKLFSFIKKPKWSMAEFKNLLENVTHDRIDNGYHVQHSIFMKAKPDSKIILFGPLLGAFHSLVRDLTELEGRKIIDDSLRLVDTNAYIVFNGDVIDSSPYISETLTLVLALMKANPTSVFYLQGKHEHADYWQNFGLKREIEARSADKAFLSLLSTFFSTLPESFVLADEFSSDDVLLISGLEKIIKSNVPCGDFRQRLGLKNWLACRKIGQETGKKLELKAVIKNENRIISYKPNPGLLLLPSEFGATTWAIFSAPNGIYTKYFDFFYDAFTILQTSKSLQDTSIALFNQDVREQTGFKKAALFNVVTGDQFKSTIQPPEEKRLLPSKEIELAQLKCTSSVKKCPESKKALATGKPLFIGCTIDLSKGASVQGKHVKEGVSLVVNRLNRKGGLNGRPIQVVFMDDEYSPERARQNVDNFIKTYNSNLLLCPMGSPTLQGYLDLIKEKKVFVFFPITGTPIVRNPEYPNVIHWRISYETEGNFLTNYVINNYHINDFAFFYQNDVFGKGPLDGALKAAQKAQKSIRTLPVPYERNTTYFKSQIDQVKAAAFTGLGFFSTSLAATEFIRQSGVDLFIGKKLFGISDLAEESFKRFARSKGLDFIIAQSIPDAQTSKMTIIKEFTAAAHEQGYAEPDPFMIEAYIGTDLAMHILQTVKEPFSIENILDVVKTYKNYDFKGLMLTYNPQTNELANNLWLYLGPNKLEKVTA